MLQPFHMFNHIPGPPINSMVGLGDLYEVSCLALKGRLRKFG